jgi:hypothetical protein
VDALASLKPPWRGIGEMTSTANKSPKPRDHNCLIASKPPLDEANGNNKVALLTLRVEIRL